MSGPQSREGKTSRDRQSGKWARHLENQDKRREWNQEFMRGAKAGGLKVIPYPRIGTQ